MQFQRTSKSKKKSKHNLVYQNSFFFLYYPFNNFKTPQAGNHCANMNSHH